MERRIASFNQRGYTLAGLLILIAIMSIFMAVSLQLWSWVKQRDNEEELIFRGREYVEAIARYHAKFNSFPPDIETLYKQKFLRRLYKDPMTKSGAWKVLNVASLVQTGAAGAINQPAQAGQNEDETTDQLGQSLETESKENQSQEDGKVKGGETSEEEPETETVGPIVGVVSRSRKKSIKIYNGQDTYNKWIFTYAVPQQQQQQQQPSPQPQPGTKPPKKGGTGNPPSEKP